MEYTEATNEVHKLIKKAQKRYQNRRTPTKFSFREVCNKWAKRSDSYTHYIHTYPAKLLPYIPIFFLFDPDYKDKKGFLLDPFSGTGTVLLEGIIHPYKKMNSLGAEINPLARLVSKVKVTPLDITVLKDIKDEILNNIKHEKITSDLLSFPNIDYWFKQKAQIELSSIKAHIDRLTNSDYKDFFCVCFSSIIRKCSLADPKISPPVLLKQRNFSDINQTKRVFKQIQEKQNPKPLRYFIETIEKNIGRIEELNKAVSIRRAFGKIIWDDVKTLKKGRYDLNGTINKKWSRKLNNVDLVITSPPYINAQKYIRTLKFELFWLGYVNESELYELDKKFIGTERVYEDTYKDIIKIDEKLADKTIKKIYKIDRYRAGIVGTFYKDMTKALTKIYQSMNIGARFVLVVGNNRIRNIKIDNCKILANIATQKIGFDIEFIIKDEIRSRGLITKRHETADIITDEWVIVFNKTG